MHANNNWKRAQENVIKSIYMTELQPRVASHKGGVRFFTSHVNKLQKIPHDADDDDSEDN